jgi:hypothetical protein
MKVNTLGFLARAALAVAGLSVRRDVPSKNVIATSDGIDKEAIDRVSGSIVKILAIPGEACALKNKSMVFGDDHRAIAKECCEACADKSTGCIRDESETLLQFMRKIDTYSPPDELQGIANKVKDKYKSIKTPKAADAGSRLLGETFAKEDSFFESGQKLAFALKFLLELAEGTEDDPSEKEFMLGLRESLEKLISLIDKEFAKVKEIDE